MVLHSFIQPVIIERFFFASVRARPQGHSHEWEGHDPCLSRAFGADNQAVVMQREYGYTGKPRELWEIRLLIQAWKVQESFQLGVISYLDLCSEEEQAM